MTNVTDSQERFEVNTLGMRQLHADRQPEQLIKELIQNTFDENITDCHITVKHELEGVLIEVKDNGRGFANIQDAYTLMGDTTKRQDPEKRGRFNLGDKEVISLARWATINTVGWTVEFPENGGRQVRPNKRKKGTIVSVMMPWSPHQASRLVHRLGLFRPPENIKYRINDRLILRHKELEVISSVLPTVIQSAPGEPLRPTRRKTDIHILQARLNRGWLYEMGIPIQEIGTPYDVDIMQKVPMPPNRDTVAESYLKDIYTQVLNAMHPIMEQPQFTETWVKTAVESPKVEADSVKTTVSQLYGDKVVFSSNDRNANMKAIDQGYQVLNPRSMSKPERDNVRTLAEVDTSHSIFGQRDLDLEDPSIYVDIANDPVKQAFAKWVIHIGRHAGKFVDPVFVNDASASLKASCTMNTDTPIMHLNTSFLDDKFLSGRGIPQLELIIHELGHAEINGKMSHGPAWGEGCARVGALIAAGLARDAAVETP